MSAEIHSNEKHEFPCDACGANLKFTPGQDSVSCEYCGHEQKIESVGEVKEIVEYDFEEALNHMPTSRPDEVMDQGHEIQCEACGAHSIITGHADRCAFCGSPVVVELTAQDSNVIPPESVLPFKIDKTVARDEFKKWINSLWFTPGKMKQRARAEGMDGVYFPYWTYDSDTSTDYTGERGTYYYETESYTNASGEEETREVRKTDWNPVSGSVGVAFDDVLIVASESLPRMMVRKLEPWDLEELKPFDPRYLSGFIAEKAGVDLKQGFEFARGRMASTIRNRIHADIGGDEQRIHSMNTTHSDVKFKQILLPLWISSFRFNDKIYRIMINARTGEVQGERPWSYIKIGLAILGGLAGGGGILALLSNDNLQNLLQMLTGSM